MHAHAGIVDVSVLIAAGCLLSQARSVLARLFAHIHWSIVPAISIIACATWFGDLWLWRSTEELAWRHNVLGSTVAVMGLAYLILRRNPQTLAPIRLAKTTLAHMQLFADCLIAFTLTMTAGYFLVVMEIRFTGGELSQAIMISLSDTPELAGYLLAK